MAHEIDRSRGKAAAYYYKEPAWHGLGVVSETARTSAEILGLAQLDFDIEQWPLYAYPPGSEELSDEGIPVLAGKWRDCSSHVANIRNDTGAVLGVVGQDYIPVQNAEAFEFVDSLVSSKDIIIESAGALQGGKKIWILARMPKVGTVAGKGFNDVHQQYLAFVNAHDGTMAVRAFPTTVRVVCMNTLRLSLSKAGTGGLTIVHRGDVAAKIDKARQILDESQRLFADYYRIGEALARVPIDSESAVEYFGYLAPYGKETKAADSANRYKSASRKLMLAAFDKPDMAGIAGSAYLALQSVTAVADHYTLRTRSTPEQRFVRTMLPGGQADSLKQAAVATAMDFFLPIQDSLRDEFAAVIESTSLMPA